MNRFCIVVLLIAFSNPASPQFSLELNTGTGRAAAQAKVLKYIDKSNRLSLYSGNQLTVKYGTSRPGFSSANILSYNFRSGIGIAAILIGGKNGLHPSAGLQFQKSIRSLYFYCLSTYELNKFTRQENYFILVYKYRLSKKIRFIFHNENYISFQDWGYDQSLERIKSGIEIRQTQFGLISETSQTKRIHQTTLVNLGAFIKQSF